jgi:hypothetical protein
MSTRTLTQENLRRLSGDRHRRGSSRKIVPAPTVGPAVPACKCWLVSCSRIEFVDEESATWLHLLTSHLPSPAPGQVIETPQDDSSWFALGWLLAPLISYVLDHFLQVTLTVSRFFPYTAPTVRHHTHSAELNVSRSHHLHLFE